MRCYLFLKLMVFVTSGVETNITASHHAKMLGMGHAPVGMSRQTRVLSRVHSPLKLGSLTCPILLSQKQYRHSSSQRLRSGVIVASGTQSGTVKMVVQGRKIELTPSIRQYAEEKVTRWLLDGCQLDRCYIILPLCRWGMQSLTLRVPSRRWM